MLSGCQGVASAVAKETFWSVVMTQVCPSNIIICIAKISHLKYFNDVSRVLSGCLGVAMIFCYLVMAQDYPKNIHVMYYIFYFELM